MGIGKKLQTIMLDWYFNQQQDYVWLSTAQNTRAEKFYTITNWTNKGILPNREVKFEMTLTDWRQKTKT